MRSIHLIFGDHVRALANLTHASKVIGRALIGLIAFLMMAMMWTERFLTWDKFLQGGQDLELSLIALVVFLCLAILLAQQSQQAVECHLAVGRLLCSAASFVGALRGRLMLRHLPLARNTFARENRTRELFTGSCLTLLTPLRI